MSDFHLITDMSVDLMSPQSCYITTEVDLNFLDNMRRPILIALTEKTFFKGERVSNYRVLPEATLVITGQSSP